MFWKNFLELCNKRETTPTAVVVELGLSRGSVTAWKEGKVPYQRTLSKIANYFGVTIEFLLMNDPQKEKPTLTGELSEAEQAILELFRKIPPEQQEMVLQMIRAALGYSV